MKLFVLVAMLGVSTVYAAEDYSTRAIKVFCSDSKQVTDKLGGSVDNSWIDKDENVWINFRDDKGRVALTIVQKDNRKQMCIVSYGTEISTDIKKYTSLQ